jgi:CO/xanthine dehydrogenase FAD-binding subunit
MILEYHRPNTIDEALKLLQRPKPVTLPLGGGTVLNATFDRNIAVVDLQKLNIDSITMKRKKLNIGATCKLQSLLEGVELPGDLSKVIRLEAAYNTRHMASVAGALVSADGRSPFTTALLSLDATLTLQPKNEEIGLGDFLPLRTYKLKGRLITQITLSNKVNFGFDYVSRTPSDRPIVCVAGTKWPSGRTRIAVGGFGDAPTLAFDGPDDHGAVTAAKNTYEQAGDQWAGADYRQEVASILTSRVLGFLD